MPRGERIERIYALIGQRIRAAREKAGLSQDILAAKVRLDRSSIVLIEGGNQRLPIDRLFQIAHELGVSAQRLLPDMEDVFSDGAVGEPSIVVHGGPEENHVKEKVLDVLDTLKQQQDGAKTA